MSFIVQDAAPSGGKNLNLRMAALFLDIDDKVSLIYFFYMNFSVTLAYKPYFVEQWFW